ncbi:LPXTG cell wall anchor domain-containing protein [Campylobacter lari]|nr:LPXTG cell wall anchor domain-containing protein [Campylobacter lari]
MQKMFEQALPFSVVAITLLGFLFITLFLFYLVKKFKDK